MSQLEAVFRNDFALDGSSRLLDSANDRETLAKQSLQAPSALSAPANNNRLS